MFPVINTDYCKGCNLCVEVCPKAVFVQGKNITPRGYFSPIVAYKERCTDYNLKKGDRILCEICWLTCPEHAIEYEVV